MKKQLSIILVILIAISSVDDVDGSQINNPVALAVTIYNDQFAMVKDTRSITFDQGRSDLYFTDVSSNIQTETVTFKAVANPEGIKVFEQNYEANLINKDAIMKKYLQKEIMIWVKLGERSIRVTGILLGYQSGYILKTQYGIEVYNNIDGIEFTSLPSGFFTKPTLNWKVFSASAITTDCEVAYRTTGFKWKSDYSIVLNGAETKADIGGWVTIDNWSGKMYEDAKLKLIAGDVNTVSTTTLFQAQPMAMMARTSASAAPSFSEKSFSDFHMYTLSEPVTLNDNSQKQVEFMPKAYGINVRKYNELSFNAGGYDETDRKARNKVEFANTQANKLGIPLPKGIMRVFKEDSADGSLQFIGEDSIDHTPKDEKITLSTGNAFDITANKRATNRQSFDKSGYRADLNLTISNHKNIAAEIVIDINNYYGSNNVFTWVTPGLNVQKVSASVLRISRIFAANQKTSILWSEDYRP